MILSFFGGNQNPTGSIFRNRERWSWWDATRWTIIEWDKPALESHKVDYH
jgi:hypothetical protein